MSGDFRQATIYIKSAVEGGPEIRIPMQRPPRAEHFTDRERELAQLLGDLQPGRVVTLCGPGGIGKTALATEALWKLAPGNELPERFPDGVIFHSFYGNPQVDLAFEKIVYAFGDEPRPTPRAAAQRVLGGKRALLLLDGTEEADDLGAVLGVRGGCGVLVTSRKRGDAASRKQRQDIAPLVIDEAVKLLREFGGNLVEEETVAVEICDRVGGLPLAVRLVGQYLGKTEELASEYLDWLKETPIRALSHGEHKEESVELLLARSLEQVSEVACQVLAVVGLLALAPFGRDPLAAALGLLSDQLRRPLNELVSYGLLLRDGDVYRVSHALVHTYARRRVAPSGEGVGRLVAYYTQLAEVESKKGLVLSEAEGLEGYRRLDSERGHIMRVLAGCVEREEWEGAWRLAWAIEDYLDVQGHWTERVIVNETGLTAARRLSRRQDEGSWLGNLGLAYAALGQVERAIEQYEQALAIAREIGDRRGEGNRLGNLGNAYAALGQVERAIEQYEQALAISREIGDRRKEGIWCWNLGLLYEESDPAHAVALMSICVAYEREIGHPDAQADAERVAQIQARLEA